MKALLVQHGRDLLAIAVVNDDQYRVQLAGDVATALEEAGRSPFDLLLSDLGLPDGSGADLMRELRHRGYTMPGVALSGYGREDDILRSREAGFAAHLVKPASPDRLIETIGAVAHRTLTSKSRSNS